MMVNDEQYNGWTNYETWLMALNINNDQCMQESVLEFAECSTNNAHDLKDWIEEMIAIKCQGIQMYKIFDSWSEREFVNIDWYELFESYQRDAEDILGDD